MERAGSELWGTYIYKCHTNGLMDGYMLDEWWTWESWLVLYMHISDTKWSHMLLCTSMSAIHFLVSVSSPATVVNTYMPHRKKRLCEFMSLYVALLYSPLYPCFYSNRWILSSMHCMFSFLLTVQIFKNNLGSFQEHMMKTMSSCALSLFFYTGEWGYSSSHFIYQC